MQSEKILQKKKEQVIELSQKLKEAKSIILADYRGLTVEQDTKLRKELREAGVEYRVVKNSILSFAAKESNLEGLQEFFKGPTAIAISSTDEVAPSKILDKYAKEFNNLELKAGVVEGNIIDVEGIKELVNTFRRIAS